MILSNNSGGANPPLATRLDEAEQKAILSVVSHVDSTPRGRERRVNIAADFVARLSQYRWGGQRNTDIYGAISRLATAGTMPLAGLVESELRRCKNAEAADWIREHSAGLFSDAQAEYWIGQVLELGRTAAIYSGAARVQGALDANQTITDVAPIIAEINAAADPVEPSPTIFDIAVNAADHLSDPEPKAEPVIDGGLRRGEVGLWTGATKTAKSWSISIGFSRNGTIFNPERSMPSY